MTANAHARWDLGGEGEGSYRIRFEITETTISEDDDGAVVAVTMHPLEVEERGLPSPGSVDRSFTLLIGSNGEVREVIDVDGVPAAELRPDELSFIGTFRPPLPLEKVGLGDRWRSRQEVQLGKVFQKITTDGVLRRLSVDAEGDIAQIQYEGGGPLVWTTGLPQGEAELTGSAETSTSARFDIGTGLLRSATSVTDGRFEVRAVPQGGLPITGTLNLKLELSLEQS